MQSPEFRHLLESFPKSVKHLIYNRNFTNKEYSLAKEPLPQHLELVSFVNKFYPTCMPDILQQHYDYVKHHLGKQARLL